MTDAVRITLTLEPNPQHAWSLCGLCREQFEGDVFMVAMHLGSADAEIEAYLCPDCAVVLAREGVAWLRQVAARHRDRMLNRAKWYEILAGAANRYRRHPPACRGGLLGEREA